MSEKEIAILIANKALDLHNADPDDDLRTVSRQLLRALELVSKAIEERDMWHNSFRELSKSHIEQANKLREYEQLR